jgi:hypothetical protein
MKTGITVIVAIFLIFGLAGGVSASLIGDDVYVEYIVKDISYPILSDWGTVDAGMETPEVEISHYYDIYFDADRVHIDFTYDNTFEATSKFSGIALDSLNDSENSDWIILGVEVETDMVGWTDDRLVFDDSGQFVGFNWQGLSTESGQSFTAIFEFGPNPIPIPATMGLFVTGLVGFMVFRRLRR